MSKNYIIHRRDRENVGDMASNPRLYFSWLKEWNCVDIVDVEWCDFKDANVILGGGGLLYDDFTPFINHIISNKSNGNIRNLIVWGIGRNRHGLSDDSLPSFGEALFEVADLVGLRDCQVNPDWVPCPSVMHPAFEPTNIQISNHEVMVCQHREDRFRFDYPQGLDDWSELKMNGRITDIINEIKASDHVLSSSYHGALWGVCAGAKVAAVNGFSQKFHTGLPDSVRLLDSLELNQGKRLREAILKSIQVNPDWLAQARMRTISFANDVQKLLSAKRK
jgi:hypothetical protein